VWFAHHHERQAGMAAGCRKCDRFSLEQCSIHLVQLILVVFHIISIDASEWPLS